MTRPDESTESEARRVALVVGSTGLVGRELVSQLLEDPDYDEVRTFVRRPSGIEHPRLSERVVDFSRISDFSAALEGEVLFSALGTTIKQAGGRDAQYAVDHDLNLALAEAAAERGVPAYVLVSSAGASPSSLTFYLRMKGRLERAVSSLSFESVRILRPGLLGGERAQSRPGEGLAQTVLGRLPAWRVFDRLRPVPAAVVARAMRLLAADWSPGVQIASAEQVWLLGADSE